MSVYKFFSKMPRNVSNFGICLNVLEFKTYYPEHLNKLDVEHD